MKGLFLAAAVVAALIFVIVSGCAAPQASTDQKTRQPEVVEAEPPPTASKLMNDEETVDSCLSFIRIGCARDLKCFSAQREENVYPVGDTGFITEDYDMALDACMQAFSYMCLGVKNFDRDDFKTCMSEVPNTTCADPPSEVCLSLFTPE